MPEKTPMTQTDADRIIDAETKKGDDRSSDGFADRALKAAVKNAGNSSRLGTGAQGNNNGGGTGKK